MSVRLHEQLKSGQVKSTKRRRWKCKKLRPRPATNAAAGGGALLHWLRADVKKVEKNWTSCVTFGLWNQQNLLVSANFLLSTFPKQRWNSDYKTAAAEDSIRRLLLRLSDRRFIDRASDWLAWNWAGHRWQAPWVRMGTINSAFRVEQNHSNCCLVL